MINSRGLCVLIGAICFVSGCGQSGPKVVEVAGTVTRNGNPVPNVALSFTPTKGRPSWGQADEHGKFKMQYTLERDGVEVGRHKVTVQFPPASVQEENDLATGKKKISGDRQAILKKYGEGAKPGLEIEVKDDSDSLEIKLD